MTRLVAGLCAEEVSRRAELTDASDASRGGMASSSALMPASRDTSCPPPSLMEPGGALLGEINASSRRPWVAACCICSWWYRSLKECSSARAAARRSSDCLFPRAELAALIRSCSGESIGIQVRGLRRSRYCIGERRRRGARGLGCGLPSTVSMRPGVVQ